MADANGQGMQTAHVAAGIAILALLGLVLLNRITLNVAVGR